MMSPPPIRQMRPRSAVQNQRVDRGLVDFLNDPSQGPRDDPTRCSTPLWMRNVGVSRPPPSAASPPRVSIMAPSDSSSRATTMVFGEARYGNRAASADSGNHLQAPNPFLKMRIPSPTLSSPHLEFGETLAGPQNPFEGQDEIDEYRSSYAEGRAEPYAMRPQEHGKEVQRESANADSAFASKNPYRNSVDPRSSYGYSTVYRHSASSGDSDEQNPFELEPDLAHITFMQNLASLPMSEEVIKTPTTLEPEYRHSASSSLYTTDQRTPAMSSAPRSRDEMVDLDADEHVRGSSQAYGTLLDSYANSARSSIVGKAM